MDRRLNTPIVPQNDFICIELFVPISPQAVNPLRLEIQTLFVLLF